jgi:rubrerythrin
LNALLLSLIELDLEAVEAYEAAIAGVHDAAIRRALSECKADHLRHADVLRPVIESSGRRAPPTPEVRRALTGGKGVISGLFGATAILTAMDANEDDTNRAYEHACDSATVPPRVRALLRAALSDERRHRAYIAQTLAAM